MRFCGLVMTVMTHPAVSSAGATFFTCTQACTQALDMRYDTSPISHGATILYMHFDLDISRRFFIKTHIQSLHASDTAELIQSQRSFSNLARGEFPEFNW